MENGTVKFRYLNFRYLKTDIFLTIKDFKVVETYFVDHQRISVFETGHFHRKNKIKCKCVKKQNKQKNCNDNTIAC